MRIPRSAVWHRFAIADTVVLPSPMAVNTSSSIAAFKASVRWCALIVWKKSCGDGCWAAEEVDMNFLSVLVRIYLCECAGDTNESGHARPSQRPSQPYSQLRHDCGAGPRFVGALRQCAKTCETGRLLQRESL